MSPSSPLIINRAEFDIPQLLAVSCKSKIPIKQTNRGMRQKYISQYCPPSINAQSMARKTKVSMAMLR